MLIPTWIKLLAPVLLLGLGLFIITMYGKSEKRNGLAEGKLICIAEKAVADKKGREVRIEKEKYVRELSDSDVVDMLAKRGWLRD